MDISTLLNVTSPAIQNVASNASTKNVKDVDESFTSMFQSALSNLNETNSLLNAYEEEEVKFALGLTDNTHDLSIAASKAYTALSYTTALRDKFLDAYKEIMNMQI